MKGALLRIPFFLVSRLPLRSARFLGRMLGNLAYALNIELTKVTRKNLSLCFSDCNSREIEQYCKSSLQHTFIFAFEACLVWLRPKSWISNKIHTIQNEHLLHEAVADNNGLIILAPHIGNWEVLGQKLPEYGEMVNLYAPPKSTSIEQIIKSGRESGGASLVPTTSRGIARLLKHLKSGGLTGILPDQVPQRSSGEYASFFGKTALTMTLLHGLITRTQCKVISAAAIRDAEGFSIHFLEVDDRIYSDDLDESLAGLNHSVEQIIELSIDQYQWEYKRFKRQPSKDVSYYDF